MQKLTGIRAYGAENFVEAFAPIFSSLGGLYFREAAGDSCFAFPFDDDSVYDGYRRAAIAEDVNGDLLFPSSVLVESAAIVDEDWNAIQLLDTQDFGVHRRFEQQRHDLAIRPVDRFVHRRIVFFHNFDGCFWQFFTNISGLGDAIVSAHRDNERFDLRHVDITEHYWNVGKYRTDLPPRVS